MVNNQVAIFIAPVVISLHPHENSLPVTYSDSEVPEVCWHHPLFFLRPQLDIHIH